MNDERVQKALNKAQSSFERLAKVDAVVHAEIGLAVLTLLAKKPTVDAEEIIAQLRYQAGEESQGPLKYRLEAAEKLLRDAQPKTPL